MASIKLTFEEIHQAIWEYIEKQYPGYIAGASTILTKNGNVTCAEIQVKKKE